MATINNPPPARTMWTALSLAKLVEQLRTVQKASGVGYKTPAALTTAQPLEAQIDAAIVQIKKTHLF
jgi:hypothetical protein